MSDQINPAPRRVSFWRLAPWGVSAALLCLPAIAMQFTTEVAWSPGDFVFMGIMFLAACGAWEMAWRVSGSNAYRAGVGLAVAASFLLIWVNLAVGFIGSEDNPANQMFAAVLVVAFVGALIGNFRPRAMARAMIGAAVVQTLIAFIALFAGMGVIFGPTAVFVAFWSMAAWLFMKAAA